MRFLHGRKAKALFAAVTACALLTVSAYAETVAEFNLSESDCGKEQISATSGSGILTASADGVNSEKIKWDSDTAHLYPRMQGKNLATGWHTGGAWSIEFSSAGAEGLSLSAVMYSSGKGPRDYELYYSFDNSEYTRIENSGVELTQSPRKVYDEFILPSELANRDKVYLKIEIASDTSIKGGTITGERDGSTYINNIIISGDVHISDNPGDTEDNPQDEKKAFYPKGVNKEYERIGKQTGKYHFYIPMYSD